MKERPTRTRTILWVIGMWWLAHLVLVLGLVLLVFLYSVAVEPGLTDVDYRAFAERSGPWFSILAGGPVFYCLGRLLRGRVPPNGRAAGLATWALYSLTDAAVSTLSLTILTPLFAAQWVTSQGVKLAAVLAATRAGR